MLSGPLDSPRPPLAKPRLNAMRAPTTTVGGDEPTSDRLDQSRGSPLELDLMTWTTRIAPRSIKPLTGAMAGVTAILLRASGIIAAGEAADRRPVPGTEGGSAGAALPRSRMASEPELALEEDLAKRQSRDLEDERCAWAAARQRGSERHFRPRAHSGHRRDAT
jgi:hypothetical protein